MTLSENSVRAWGFGTEFFAELCRKSQENPRRRTHHNIHQDLDAACHRMLVAIQPGAVVRPHRHLRDPKPETLICLQGSLGVLTFDHEGNPLDRLRLTPLGDQQGCDIPVGCWHAIVGLAPDTVFVEVKPGPYVPFAPSDFAPWVGDVADTALAESLQLMLAAR